MTPADGSAPGHSRLVASLLLAAMLIPLASTMLAVAVPGMAASLSVAATTLTPWLVTSYLVVSVVGQWPGGRLGDRIGHARALALGQTLCGAAAVLGAVSSSLPPLVAARVLMAGGGAIMVPAAMALLRETTSPERRARAFGFFGSVMGVAAAIGPLVAGELVERFGWRSTFLVLLPPVAASALLARGVRVAERSARPTGGSLAQLGSLLRRRPFIGGGLAVAFQNTAMYAALFQVPLLLSELRSEPASIVGRVLLAMTGSMVVGSLLGGRVSEAIGARLTIIGASALSVAGLLLLHDVPGIEGAADALPGLALLGLGVGLTNGPAQAAALSSVRAEEAAAAAGALSALRYVGGILGMALLVPLKSHGTVSSGEHAHAVVFLLLAGAAAIAGACGVLVVDARGEATA